MAKYKSCVQNLKEPLFTSMSVLSFMNTVELLLGDWSMDHDGYETVRLLRLLVLKICECISLLTLAQLHMIAVLLRSHVQLLLVSNS